METNKLIELLKSLDIKSVNSIYISYTTNLGDYKSLDFKIE